MYLKKKAQTSDENLHQRAGSFINNSAASEAVKEAASVPLLYVDDSNESKKAITKLDEAKRLYIVKKVSSRYERESLHPPILYTSDGIFKGYSSIMNYADSKLWLTTKA